MSRRSATTPPPHPARAVARAGLPHRFAIRFAAAAAIAALAGCAPPTDVVDMRDVPQATRDAMLHVRILPLGTAIPPGVGSVGPLSGFGCGISSVAASSAAVQQLQIKALRLQATAVAQVQIGPGSGFTCSTPYSAIAQGIALAPRGLPSPY